MTIDVAQKAISSNPIKNNRVVVGVSPVKGVVDIKNNGENVYIDENELETRLTDRFDDRLFYSC